MGHLHSGSTRVLEATGSVAESKLQDKVGMHVNELLMSHPREVDNLKCHLWEELVDQVARGSSAVFSSKTAHPGARAAGLALALRGGHACSLALFRQMPFVRLRRALLLRGAEGWFCFSLM